MIKLYRHPLSGHSHRAELFLSLLGLEFTLIDVDLLNGEHKSEAFLKLTPFGQVPVLDDNGIIIYDSNAILVYLATKYDNGKWLPTEANTVAEIQQWLSLAAGPIASGPARARLINVFSANYNKDETIKNANDLLTVIDSIIGERTFLLGDSPTIADIATYTYIAHAPEGDVSLQPYKNIKAWLKHVESLKGFVGMSSSKVGLAA